MAQVAKVEVSTAGAVRVRRVVCAVDCGTVVNPDTVRAQIEGAVIFGITAPLYGEITLEDGRVQQANFDSYKILRIDEAPTIEVHIVHSSEPKGRIGEPGTSAIVPAVTNKIWGNRQTAAKAADRHRRSERAGVSVAASGWGTSNALPRGPLRRFSSRNRFSWSH